MALKSKRVDALLYPKNASQSSSSTSPFTTAEQKRARENIGMDNYMSQTVDGSTIIFENHKLSTPTKGKVCRLLLRTDITDATEPVTEDAINYMRFLDIADTEDPSGCKKVTIAELAEIITAGYNIVLYKRSSDPLDFSFYSPVRVLGDSGQSISRIEFSRIGYSFLDPYSIVMLVFIPSNNYLRVMRYSYNMDGVRYSNLEHIATLQQKLSAEAGSGILLDTASVHQFLYNSTVPVRVDWSYVQKKLTADEGITIDSSTNKISSHGLHIFVKGTVELSTIPGYEHFQENWDGNEESLPPGVTYDSTTELLYMTVLFDTWREDESMPSGYAIATPDDIRKSYKSGNLPAYYENGGGVYLLTMASYIEDESRFPPLWFNRTGGHGGDALETAQIHFSPILDFGTGEFACYREDSYYNFNLLSRAGISDDSGLETSWDQQLRCYQLRCKNPVPSPTGHTQGSVLKIGSSGMEWGEASASASTHFFLIPEPPASESDPWYVLDMSKPVENPNEGAPEYEQALVEDIVEYLSNKEEVVFVAVDNMNRYLPVQSFSISGSQDEDVIIVCTNIDTDSGELALIQKGVVISEEDGSDGYTGYLIVDRENTIFAEVEGLPSHTSANAGMVLCLDSDGVPQWKKHTKVHLLLGYFNQYLYDTEKDSETEPYCEKITLNDLIDMYEAGETFVLRYGNASSGDYYALRRLQYSSSHDTELIFDQIVFDYGPDKQTPSLYHSAKVLSISYTEEYTETEVGGETVREYTGYLKEHYNQTFNLQEKLSIGAESGLIMGADGKSLSVDKDSIEVQVSKEIDDAVKTVKSHVIYTFSPAAINSRINNIKSDQAPANNQCTPTAFCTVISPSMNMELSTDTSIVFFTTSNAASNSASSAPAYIVIEQIGLNEGSLKWVANSGNIADQLKTAGKQVVKLLDIDTEGGKNVTLSSDRLYYICLVISSGNDIQPVGIQASTLGLNPSTYRRVQFNTQPPPDHTAMRTIFPNVCTGSSFGSELSSPIFFALTNMAVDTGGAVITRNPPFDTISGYTLTKKAISTFFDSDPSDILQKITPTANCTLKSWSVIDSQSSVSDASMLGKIFAWVGSNPTEVHTHGSGGQSTGGTISTTALSGSEAGYYKHTYTATSGVPLTGGQEYQFPVTTALGSNRSNVIVQYSGGFTRDLVFWRYNTENLVRTFGAYLEVTVEYNGQTITGVI